MKRTIQELCDERGESRSDLAAALGVTLDEVTDWELGRSEPSITRMRALTDHFDVRDDQINLRPRESSPESLDATILVTAMVCSPGTLPATADWYADCHDPLVDARFLLAPHDGAQRTQERTRTTDAAGQGRFDDLPPGSYHLRPDGSVWWHAESDSVDAAGNVVVRAEQDANVWVFYCTGLGAPPPPGK